MIIYPHRSRTKYAENPKIVKHNLGEGRELPVQKLASAFLYISQSCLYLTGNIQNLCEFFIKMGSSSCISPSLSSIPFVREPIFCISATRQRKEEKPYKNPSARNRVVGWILESEWHSNRSKYYFRFSTCLSLSVVVCSMAFVLLHGSRPCTASFLKCGHVHI